MQGVILDEMRMYVVDAFGAPIWSKVLAGSGRPADHSYVAGQAYPDQELGLLAMHAAQITGRPLPEILEAFGEAMVPDMFKYYSILVNPRWSFIEFLLGMEPVLHAALHLHAPGALPVKIQATRTGAGSVRVVYDSPLRACAAVRAVIQGAALHYRGPVSITEEQCVLRGDPACVISVVGQ